MKQNNLIFFSSVCTHKKDFFLKNQMVTFRGPCTIQPFRRNDEGGGGGVDKIFLEKNSTEYRLSLFENQINFNPIRKAIT